MMRVEDEPQSNHTTWKKAGIILLGFFNAYPVTDVFGTGDTGDDDLLIPLVLIQATVILECGDLSPLCFSHTAFLAIGVGKQSTFHFSFR